MVTGGVGGIVGEWIGGFVGVEMDCDGDVDESEVRKI